MATMKQIAQLAGVSRGTVDRVLNKRGSVKEETALKITEIANSLQYTPSKAARALATLKRDLKLSYIMPDPNANHFFQQVKEGVLEKAADLQEYGVTVELLCSDFSNPDCQVKLLEQAVANGTSGIVIAGFNRKETAAKLLEISSSGIPVVTANTDIANCGRIAYVGSDAYKSGQTAAGIARMIVHNHAKVGIITGSRSIQCHTERIRGFTDHLQQYAPEIKITEIKENKDDDFESFAVTKELLLSHPEMDLLFLSGAGVFGACRAIEKFRPNSPLKVICYDCTQETKVMLEKGIIHVSICQQPEIQGSKPLDILFNSIALNVPPAQEYSYTKNEIIIRESL